MRLAVMLQVRFPLSLRDVEDLLQERGIEIRPETIRFWWNRFGPMFAAAVQGQDEPQTLRCAISPGCPTGADGGQERTPGQPSLGVTGNQGSSLCYRRTRKFPACSVRYCIRMPSASLVVESRNRLAVP